MGRHLAFGIKRFTSFLVDCCLLIILTFFLIRLFPGNAFIQEESIDPQVKLLLQQRYLPSQNLFEQFNFFVSDFMEGEFGYSLHFLGKSVKSIVAEHGAVSLKLGGMAFVISLILGLILGFFFSKKKKSSKLNLFVTAVYSVPMIVMGPVLILVFCIYLEIFPVALLESAYSYILPIFILSIKPTVSFARIFSESIRNNLDQSYVMACRGYGYSEEQIIFKWAFKNSLLPLVAQIPPKLVGLVSGGLLVEAMFAIPGIGTHFVDGVLNRDWPLVIGLSTFYGSLILFLYFLSDLFISFLDPRIRQ